MGMSPKQPGIPQPQPLGGNSQHPPTCLVGGVCPRWLVTFEGRLSPLSCTWSQENGEVKMLPCPVCPFRLRSPGSLGEEQGEGLEEMPPLLPHMLCPQAFLGPLALPQPQGLWNSLPQPIVWPRLPWPLEITAAGQTAYTSLGLRAPWAPMPPTGPQSPGDKGQGCSETPLWRCQSTWLRGSSVTGRPV